MARGKQPRHPLLLTVRETCLVLRCHRPKVYELIGEGLLQGFKIGSDWRIKRDSVEKLVGPIPVDFFEGTDVAKKEKSSDDTAAAEG